MKVTHVYREANMIAISLANMGCNLDIDLAVYENPPAQFSHLLLSDVTGVSSSPIVIAL